MILDLGFLVLLVLWSAVVGSWCLDRLDPVATHAFDRYALAVPLGLGALALATLGLAELGFLDRASLALFLVSVGIGCVLTRWRRFRPAGDRWLRHATLSHGDGPRSLRLRRPPALDLAFAVALAFAILGTFVSALAPVTDGDALCYHLQVPKVFLERGGVFYDPDLHETVYPLLTELLYAGALAFRGPVACRLVQWLIGLVFAANVTALARPSLGKRAWWAGTIALLVPAVSNGMGAPLNDVALAAFGTAAIVAWSRHQETPGARKAILTGVFTGLAIGVKYPALVLTGLLAITLACRPLIRAPEQALRTRLGFAARHLALFGLAAIAVGGAWYARAWVHTGNPVYPFYAHVFGGAGLTEVLDPARRAMPVTAWNVLTALVPMTLQPARFDSVSHQFGPVFLLFLPALLLEKRPGRVTAVTALGYAFLTICVSQRQSMRFVLIALGPMSVAVAWLARAWDERRSAACRFLLVALVLTLFFEAGIAALRARHGLGVVLGRETAEEFLSRREPTYRVGKWVGENLPPDARLVGQDHRGFYIPRPYTMELAHRRRTGLGRRGEESRSVVAQLRREGFSHVMLCPPVPETAVEFDPTLGRLLASWLEARAPLYREDIADADGVVRRYAIYALGERTAEGDGRRARR